MASARGRGEAPTDATSALTVQGSAAGCRWPGRKAPSATARTIHHARYPTHALRRHIRRMVSPLPKVPKSPRESFSEL
jgi:hypothetical protein